MSSKLGIISILAGILLLLNSGCTSGSIGADGSQVEVMPVKPQKERVFFDNIAQIPLGAKDSTVLFRIHNDFASQLVLKSVKVINPSTNKEDSQLATINSSGCSLVPAANSCSIGITPHLQHSGSFILEASLAANNGKIHKLRQLIRVSNQIKANNGIAFANDFSRMASVDGRYNLAFPVLLSEKFDDVKVSNGNLICNGNYSPGSLCTYFVDGKVSQDNTLISLSVTGYKEDMAIASNKSSILYTMAVDKEAHLLISQPADIKIGRDEDEKTTDITIFNNGLASATNISIQVNDLNSILSLKSGCKDVLAIGEACTFTIKARGNKSGVGSVTASYQIKTSGAVARMVVNTTYIKEDYGAALEIWHTKTLLDTLIGTTSAMDIKVYNGGASAVYGVSYSVRQIDDLIVKGQDLRDGVETIPACNYLKIIAPGKSCGLRISYTPIVSTLSSGEVFYLNVRGNYTNAENQNGTIITSFWSKYSALDPALINPLTVSETKLDFVARPLSIKEKYVEITNNTYFKVEFGEFSFGDNDGDAPSIIWKSIDGGHVCKPGKVLGALESCSFKVRYRGKHGHHKSYLLKIKLAKFGGLSSTIEYPIMINTRTSNYTPAHISVTMDTQQPLPANITLDPHLANKYKVYALPGNDTLKLNYTFTFSGGDSYDFNVSSSGLPIGAHILSDSIGNKHNTCPTGIEHANYFAGEACVVVVEVPKLSLIGNASNIIPSNLITPVLHYSWRDKGKDGVNVNSRSTADDGLNPQLEVITSWLNDFKITTTDFELAADPTSVEAIITAGFNSPTKPINFNYPLIVTARIMVDGGLNYKEESCQITDATVQQCQLTVAIDKDAADGEYHYEVIVRDSSAAVRSYNETVTIHKKP